jgi:hypothetical protein
MEDIAFVEYGVTIYGSINIGIDDNIEGIASIDLRPDAKE